MSNRLASLDTVLLMGPGPSPVAESVYKAMPRPTIGHMDPAFIAVMDDIKGQLRQLCHTANKVTLPMSGTGSAGMETCFVNLVEPGCKVLVLQNGVFGKRMVDVAGRLGAQVDELEFDWGTPVVVEAVAAKLAAKKYDIVAIVHAETSTGVENPVEAVGKLVHQNGALYLVDSVTGLGGIRVELDKWGVDAFYSGSQKCLSCPPGLAPVSFSERAVERITHRSAKVPNWYLDMNMIVAYWDGNTRSYHHTAPINMNYALYQALFNLAEEGEDAVLARHRAMHLRLLEGMEAMGFKPFVDEAHRLPMVNLFTCPEGVNEAKLRADLRNRHLIEIGGGLGVLAGKVLRIGVMGEGARPEPVDRLLAAVKDCLRG